MDGPDGFVYRVGNLGPGLIGQATYLAVWPVLIGLEIWAQVPTVYWTGHLLWLAWAATFLNGLELD